MSGAQRLHVSRIRTPAQGRGEVDVARALDPLAEGETAAQVQPGDEAVGHGAEERRTDGRDCPREIPHAVVRRTATSGRRPRGRARRASPRRHPPRTARPTPRPPRTRRRPGTRTVDGRTPPAPSPPRRRRRGASTTTAVRPASAVGRSPAARGGSYVTHRGDDE